MCGRHKTYYWHATQLSVQQAEFGLCPTRSLFEPDSYIKIVYNQTLQQRHSYSKEMSGIICMMTTHGECLCITYVTRTRCIPLAEGVCGIALD